MNRNWNPIHEEPLETAKGELRGNLVISINRIRQLNKPAIVQLITTVTGVAAKS